jgi:hypothetical protein
MAVVYRTVDGWQPATRTGSTDQALKDILGAIDHLNAEEGPHGTAHARAEPAPPRTRSWPSTPSTMPS